MQVLQQVILLRTEPTLLQEEVRSRAYRRPISPSRWANAWRRYPKSWRGATGKRGAPNNNSRANNTGAQNTSSSIDMAGVIDAGLGNDEFEGNAIYLLLDTGTVSNPVPEDQRGVVQNVYNGKTSLIGVGGARVRQIQNSPGVRSHLHVVGQSWYSSSSIVMYEVTYLTL